MTFSGIEWEFRSSSIRSIDATVFDCHIVSNSNNSSNNDNDSNGENVDKNDSNNTVNEDNDNNDGNNKDNSNVNNNDDDDDDDNNSNNCNANGRHLLSRLESRVSPLEWEKEKEAEENIWLTYQK